MPVSTTLNGGKDAIEADRVQLMSLLYHAAANQFEHIELKVVASSGNRQIFIC